jgi:NADPH:quinone reductase-like Zn-dependent oxidoreductase
MTKQKGCQHHRNRLQDSSDALDGIEQDFVEVIRQEKPQGLNAVFDGMAGDYFGRSYSLLRRGGRLVGYGNPLSTVGMLKFLGQIILFSLLPDGKSARPYSTGLSRFEWRQFFGDWARLFKLLGEGKIDPVIAAQFPLLEACKANALLESGQVIDNIVLRVPELL